MEQMDYFDADSEISKKMSQHFIGNAPVKLLYDRLKSVKEIKDPTPFQLEAIKKVKTKIKEELKRRGFNA